MLRKFAAVLLLLPVPAQAADYPFHKLTASTEVAQRTAAFKRVLAMYGFAGQGLTCKVIVESTVTKYRDLWAGYCTMRVGKKTIGASLCMDEMVGNFAMSTTGGSVEADLANFSEANCGAA